MTARSTRMGSHDSSPRSSVMWRHGISRCHTWPPLGATTHGGKRYEPTLAKAVKDMRTSTKLLNTLYRGAGTSLLLLVYETAAEAHTKRVPALFDEARCPLCDADSPLRSFLWDGSTLAQLPSPEDAAEVVLPVLTQLRMDAPEVVLAIAILQRLVEWHGAVLQARSARPIFLAACVLALKLTTDNNVSTRDCYDAVADCFTGLSPLLLARVEEQLLEMLDWRVPNDPQLFERYARALVRAGLPPGVALHEASLPVLYP